MPGPVRGRRRILRLRTQLLISPILHGHLIILLPLPSIRIPMDLLGVPLRLHIYTSQVEFHLVHEYNLLLSPPQSLFIGKIVTRRTRDLVLPRQILRGLRVRRQTRLPLRSWGQSSKRMSGRAVRQLPRTGSERNGYRRKFQREMHDIWFHFYSWEVLLLLR